jgi:TetR/AcrR family transcriptional regulator
MIARRKQEARRDESRSKILTAAEQVFASEGMAGARTDAIAASAGVNKALLYYYFNGKEQLYEAVMERHLRDFNERALAVLNAPGPARSLLLRYMELHFDFISQRHLHAPLFQQLVSKGSKPAERMFRKYIGPRTEVLQKLLERGMREGDFRNADPFHTAFSIAALIVFYFSAAPVLQSIGYTDPYAPANLKRRKQEVLAFVRQALFTNPNVPES